MWKLPKVPLFLISYDKMIFYQFATKKISRPTATENPYHFNVFLQREAFNNHVTCTRMQTTIFSNVLFVKSIGDIL